MATQADVRRIARSLPGTTANPKGFGFKVRHGAKDKGLLWAWNERVDPKKPRVPRADVIALRVAMEDKEMLLAADEAIFFTEPHYNGYPAVLVRLPAIELDALEALLTSAWRGLAAPALIAEFDRRVARPRRASRAKKRA